MSQPKDLNSTEAEFQRFLRGEELGFRQIFNRYKDVLYRYAYGISKCDFEAEEIVQEAFIRLYKHKSQIHDFEQLYPYLFVIVKRLLIASFRKKIIHTKYQNYLSQQWYENCDDTQQCLEVNELRLLVNEAMMSLPPKEKEAFDLNKLQGLSYQDISDFTGNSKNTVKNQIISASKKVRLKLEKYYFPVLVFLLFLY